MTWLVVGLWVLAGASESPESTELAQNRTQESLEVLVVTGSRVEESQQEAVVPVAVVSRQDIENTGANSVDQALQLIPGLRMVRDVAGGTKIQMRGFSSDHVLILIDGVRVTGAQNGSVDLTRLSARGVERIEVLKGPASAVFGADALAGVINIITSKPKEGLQGAVFVQGEASPGAPESKPIGISAGGDGSYRLGELSFSLNGSYRQQTSYNLEPWIDNPVTHQRERDPNTTGAGLKDGDISGGLIWEPEFMRLTARAELSTRRLHAVDAGDFLPRGQRPVYDRDQAFETVNAYLMGEFWIPQGRAVATLSTSVYRERYDRGLRLTDEKKHEFMNDSIVQLSLQADQLIGSFLFVGGVEGLYHVVDSSRYPNFHPRYRGSVFVQAEWRVLDELSLLAGARWDQDSQFGGHGTPRALLRYEIMPELLLRAGWGLGFKAPLPRDLGIFFENPAYGYRVEGNNNLKPEESQSVDLSLEYIPETWLRFEVGGHMSWVKNLIGPTAGTRPDPTGPIVYTYGNFSRIRIRGIEAAGEVHPLDELRLRVSYDLLDTQSERSKQTLADRSPHRVVGSVFYDLDNPDLSFFAALGWTSKRVFYGSDSSDPTKLQRLEAPGFVTLEARVSYRFLQHYEAYVGGRNLAGAYDARFLQIAPRSVYAGLRGQL